VKPSGQDETWSSMAQTQVLRKALLTKNMVIGSQLAPGLRQSDREETKEVKLSISIVLRARMEFLRTTMVTASCVSCVVCHSPHQSSIESSIVPVSRVVNCDQTSSSN
jgi:hypothetical protein